MPLAKLYTNSLMSTLNSRRMWLAEACDDSGSMGHNGQRSRVNVNVLRSEAAGRKSKNTRVRSSVGPSFPEFVRPLSRLLSTGFRGTDSPRLLLQVTDRIVIGVESHQMTDFADVKDDHYAPSSMSLVPEEKSSSTSA